MNTSFKVFASYVSIISGAEIRHQLIKNGEGYVFQNMETGKIETGTFVDRPLEALDKFRHIFGEMKPSFELL